MAESDERPYGVECKNPRCGTGITLGRYRRPRKQSGGGDRLSFPVVKLGTVKCPDCGEEHEYDQGDLREFPL
jgi:hypothetical protein